MIALLFALLGCPSPVTPIEPAPPGCALCSPETFCVVNRDVDRNTLDTSCVPIPEDCDGDQLDCADNTCRAAAHDHCAVGFDPSTCQPDQLVCVEEEL